jgi:hypothetical protein
MRLRVLALTGLACWAVSVVAVLAIHPPISADDSAQNLATTIPAAGLTRLVLSALDGTVDLRAATDPTADELEVRVGVQRANANTWIRKPGPDVPNVTFRSDRRDGELRLVLNGITVGSAETVWTITVPARLAVRIEMHNGRVAVTGVAGGVQVSVNSGLNGKSGEILADVPNGPLDLDLGVGTIDARTSATTYGRVDVHSTVGDARLFLDGHEVVAPHAPGPGQRLRLAGDHTSALSLSVTVGDVTLRIR